MMIWMIIGPLIGKGLDQMMPVVCRSYETSLLRNVKGVVAGDAHGDYEYGEMSRPPPRCRCDATRHKFPITGHPGSILGRCLALRPSCRVHVAGKILSEVTQAFENDLR